VTHYEPQLIQLLKQQARTAQRDTNTCTATGITKFGPVSVAFYPCCERYTFWLHDEPTSQSKIMQWLTQEVTR
jgi:hypothetical protein